MKTVLAKQLYPTDFKYPEKVKLIVFDGFYF
jgi:hypothetical protein